MRVFLFEFVSGGGWWKVDSTARPPKSLLREGKTMLAALASDLTAIDGCEVTFLQDRRVRTPVEVAGAQRITVAGPIELFRQFRDLAPQTDFGIIIAPEFNGYLSDWAEKWRLLGGTLLGPSHAFIRLAESKSRTAEHLTAAGLRVPQGVQLGWPEKLPEDFPLPAVLKPDDGAGSQGLIYIRERRDGAVRKRMNFSDWRLEQFCPGLPVSVAILAGSAGPVALPACLQWLTDDHRFRYQGGMAPIRDDLNARAHQLALAVAAVMPPAIGYFGIDMILGEADDGSQDYVIEVNPRLTTSYVGLRTIAQGNLAAAMLDIAAGRVANLSFEDRRVQFTPDGQVVALS